MGNSTLDFISELVIITVIGYIINRFAFWIGICIKIWCEEVIFKYRLWFSKGTTVKDICDEHFSECMRCPLYKRICNGLGGWQRAPYLWQMLN